LNKIQCAEKYDTYFTTESIMLTKKGGTT